jgi:hypothetical protein
MRWAVGCAALSWLARAQEVELELEPVQCGARVVFSGVRCECGPGWFANASGACECGPGQVLGANGTCAACPAGTFKASVGDLGACAVCPANADSVADRSGCACQEDLEFNATRGSCDCPATRPPPVPVRGALLVAAPLGITSAGSASSAWGDSGVVDLVVDLPVSALFVAARESNLTSVRLRWESGGGRQRGDSAGELNLTSDSVATASISALASGVNLRDPQLLELYADATDACGHATDRAVLVRIVPFLASASLPEELRAGVGAWASWGAFGLNASRWEVRLESLVAASGSSRKLLGSNLTGTELGGVVRGVTGASASASSGRGRRLGGNDMGGNSSAWTVPPQWAARSVSLGATVALRERATGLDSADARTRGVSVVALVGAGNSNKNSNSSASVPLGTVWSPGAVAVERSVAVVSGNWSACSASECGAPGLQRRVSECQVWNATSGRAKSEAWWARPISRCSLLGMAEPESLRACVAPGACRHWRLGDWGACSSTLTCVPGVQSRLAACVDTDGSADVGAGSCNGVARDALALSRPCNARCHPARLALPVAGECVASVAACVDRLSGRLLAPALCVALPELATPSPDQACARFGPWSPCSATCGASGLTVRQLFDVHGNANGTESRACNTSPCSPQAVIARNVCLSGASLAFEPCAPGLGGMSCETLCYSSDDSSTAVPSAAPSAAPSASAPSAAPSAAPSSAPNTTLPSAAPSSAPNTKTALPSAAPSRFAPNTTLPSAAPSSAAPGTTQPTPASSSNSTLAPVTGAPSSDSSAPSTRTTVQPSSQLSPRPTQAPSASAGAPASASPSTGAPASSKPTPGTGAPTTGAPSTVAPSLGAPESASPTTGAPSTGAPTSTGAPSTGTPTTTGAPSTGAPTSASPSTGSPTSVATTTGSPITGLPTTPNPTSARPSVAPTSAAPTTRAPSLQPSAPTTSAPSLQPTAQPSSKPSVKPSSAPTRQPSAVPSGKPTSAPSVAPTVSPTFFPTVPTDAPSPAPTTSKPSSPTTRAPTAGKPTSGKPTTGGPTRKPTTGKPSTGMPTTGKPTTGSPTPVSKATTGTSSGSGRRRALSSGVAELPLILGCDGAMTSSGECCGPDGGVDSQGRCCPLSQLDACGVCGGSAQFVDLAGRCCASVDALGFCCGKVDLLGVCNGTAFPPGPVPQPVCGNGVCELGEACATDEDAECCAGDCPFTRAGCPASGPFGQACGGAGRCLTATARCDCFAASGRLPGADYSCDGTACQSGFVSTPLGCVQAEIVAAALCSNGALDEGELGVDCGGPCPATCSERPPAGAPPSTVRTTGSPGNVDDRAEPPKTAESTSSSSAFPPYAIGILAALGAVGLVAAFFVVRNRRHLGASKAEASGASGGSSADNMSPGGLRQKVEPLGGAPLVETGSASGGGSGSSRKLTGGPGAGSSRWATKKPSSRLLTASSSEEAGEAGQDPSRLLDESQGIDLEFLPPPPPSTTHSQRWDGWAEAEGDHEEAEAEAALAAALARPSPEDTAANLERLDELQFRESLLSSEAAMEGWLKRKKSGHRVYVVLKPVGELLLYGEMLQTGFGNVHINLLKSINIRDALYVKRVAGSTSPRASRRASTGQTLLKALTPRSKSAAPLPSASSAHDSSSSVSGSQRGLSGASGPGTGTGTGAGSAAAPTTTTPKRKTSRASKGARGPPSEFPCEFHIINDIALGVNATKTLAFGAPDEESCERWVRTLSCLIAMYGEQRLPAGRTPKAAAPRVPATPRLPTIPGLVDTSECEEDKPATAMGRKARSAPPGEPQRSAPLEPFPPALPSKERPGLGRAGSSNAAAKAKASSGRSLKRRSKSVGARRDKQAPPLPPWDPARAEAAVLESSETVQRMRSRSLPSRERARARARSLPDAGTGSGTGTVREPDSAREPGGDALARNNRIWERFMDAAESQPPQQRRRPDWGDDL